ncbi:MAG: hypothetical protein U0271_18710 [Polyangiaceae bacterium]
MESGIELAVPFLEMALRPIDRASRIGLSPLVVNTPLDQAIKRRVDAFVSELRQHVRNQTLSSISQTLGLQAGAAAAAAAKLAKAASKKAPKAKPGRAAAKSAPVGKAASPKAAKPGTRRRRSAEEIDALAGQIHQYVKSNPGKRAEDIKAALRIAPNDWALPVERLVSTGKLSTKGEKRATRYHAK